MGGDGIVADRLDVVDGGCEPDRAGDVRGARLELPWQFVVFGPFESNRTDHIAATLPWWHCFQQACLAIERSNPRRSVELVPGEYVEVAVERLHVDRLMRYGLGAVNQHRNSARLGEADHIFDGHDGAERVGDMRYRDQLGAWPHQPRERVQV